MDKYKAGFSLNFSCERKEYNATRLFPVVKFQSVRMKKKTLPKQKKTGGRDLWNILKVLWCKIISKKLQKALDGLGKSSR